MQNYRLLKEKANNAVNEIKNETENLKKIADESHRVSQVSANVHIILKDLDRQFEQATKLNSTDITFLFFAIALQCARQYLLTGFKERETDQKAASKVKKDKEHSDRNHELYCPSYQQIITNPVPYDAIFGSAELDLGFSGKNHRIKTLGHDPLLGWIFGTSNIVTSTLTLSSLPFNSYHVETGITANGHSRDKITSPASTLRVFNHTKDRLVHEGVEGKTIVGYSLLKQYMHLKSDIYSKESLPLPVVSVISEKLALKLGEYGLDMGNLLTVGEQAAMAALINTFIAMIHGLFYDEIKYLSWSLYEVKTRKILSYSNIVASVSNILQATFRGVVLHDVDGACRSLDIGGYLVTLYRIINDYKFQKQIKQEFLEKEFYNIVMG